METSKMETRQTVEDLSGGEVRLVLDRPVPQQNSVKLGVTALLSHKWLIIVMVFIFSLVGVAGSFVYSHYISVSRGYKGIASAIMVFGFPEAEDGLDPLGNRLDVNAIRSPFVIGQAIDTLGLREYGISPEAVRNSLSVGRLVPHETLLDILLIHDSALRQPQRLEALEEVVFHSTTHLLELEQSGALLSLSQQQLNDLLNQIVIEYQSYFVQAYNELYFLDVIIGHFDPAHYDFHDLARILQGTAVNMLSYLSAMREKSPDFRSPSTGMTFGDIWANINLINTVDIRSVSALIHVNNMSRNRIRSANILDYEIRRLEQAFDVSSSNIDDFLMVLNEVYEREVWVLHHMGEYYRYDRSSDLYDNLVAGLLEEMQNANQLEADIAFYRDRLLSLRRAQAPISQDDIRFVEEAIPALFASLQTWEGTINQTVEDYFYLELFRDAVRLVSPSYFTLATSASLQNRLLIIAGGAFTGFFISVMIALYKGERRKYPHGAIA